MKPIDDSVHDDDHRFDLLVDDELDDAQRRELLANLDDEPGGWRRCALAFLEAQSWKNDLGALLREPAEPAAAAPAPGRGPGPRGRRVLTVLAMAASFLLALAVAQRIQDAWRGGPGVPRPSLQEIATVEEPAPSEIAPQEITPQMPDGPSDRWQMVTVAGPQGPDGAAEELRLPAVERNEFDQQWLDGLPGAIPDEILQALERTGHRVKRHRELVPLPMQDGRRLLVPVDQVDVQYVGRPTL